MIRSQPSAGPRPMVDAAAATLVVALAAATAVLWPARALAAAAEPEVGQVSLLIGEAHVVRRGGDVETLRRGSPILVGDRIETAANGHVHVRFVDHAAVSVRPQSVLEVQAYRYDAEHPQHNQVRLRIENGTGRSISGDAIEADKSRFRLNTPVAAIGVRGTDFIVQTDRSGLRATVAEGAISVTALGADAQTARVLSADMGNVMIELRPGEQVARVVPAAGPLIAAAAGGGEDRLAQRLAAEAAARSAGLLAAEPDTPTAASRVGGASAAAENVLAIAAASVPDLNSASDPNGRLAWGRWTFSPENGDRVSVPFAVAATGRTITVADSASGLFRSPLAADATDVFAGGVDGAVDFRLSRGHATFETGGRTEQAEIGGGRLSIDFGRRSFATALAFSAPSAGAAELRMAGDVRSDGTFAARDALQRIAGAVSLDGREAGYLFERVVGGGLFRGKTLWGR